MSGMLECKKCGGYVFRGPVICADCMKQTDYPGSNSGNCYLLCRECGNEMTVAPPVGKQLVSNEAIEWLWRNHPDVYRGFYERV